MAGAFKGSRHPQCRPPVHAGNKKETGYGKDVWSMLLTKKQSTTLGIQPAYRAPRPAPISVVAEFCHDGLCNNWTSQGLRHGPQTRLTNHPPRNPVHLNLHIHPSTRCPSQMWVSGTRTGTGLAKLAAWLASLNKVQCPTRNLCYKAVRQMLTD